MSYDSESDIDMDVVEKNEQAAEERKRVEAAQAQAEAEAKASEFTKAGVGADFLEDLLSGNLKDAEEFEEKKKHEFDETDMI